MKVKLGSFLQEVCEKTTMNNQYPVLTSSKAGLFLQSDYFNKQVASKDNTGYKIIRRGQYTYRAMSDTGQFFPNMLDCVDIGIVSPAYPVFKIVKEGVIEPEFLKYFFKSKGFQQAISSFAQGSTRTSIKYEKLKTVSIDIPVLEQQRDIIKTLDKVESVLSCRVREISKLDELIKARFVEMFGDLADPECKWDKCRIVDACPGTDDIKCGPFGTQLNKNEYLNSGIAVWEIPQINMAFQVPPTHYVSKEKATELKAYSIVAGDIAMSRKGNVGKCAVFPEGLNAGIIHSDVLRIRLDTTRIVPEFMMRQLHYSGAVQQQIELISSGAIMAGINVTKLKEIYVHIPPKRLQDQFATFVKQVDKSKLIGLLIQQQIKRRFLYDQL